MSVYTLLITLWKYYSWYIILRTHKRHKRVAPCLSCYSNASVINWWSLWCTLYYSNKTRTLVLSIPTSQTHTYLHMTPSYHSFLDPSYYSKNYGNYAIQKLDIQIEGRWRQGRWRDMWYGYIPQFDALSMPWAEYRLMEHKRMERTTSITWIPLYT